MTLRITISGDTLRMGEALFFIHNQMWHNIGISLDHDRIKEQAQQEVAKASKDDATGKLVVALVFSNEEIASFEKEGNLKKYFEIYVGEKNVTIELS